MSKQKEKKILYAEELKQINARKVQEYENPNIENWKKKQKQHLIELKSKIVKHFEWVASFGGLFDGSPHNPYKISCWGEETSNIPNAEELTKDILEKLLQPYGIKVKRVLIERGSSINALVAIEK